MHEVTKSLQGFCDCSRPYLLRTMLYRLYAQHRAAQQLLSGTYTLPVEVSISEILPVNSCFGVLKCICAVAVV
jgi:hypothetical protein